MFSAATSRAGRAIRWGHPEFAKEPSIYNVECRGSEQGGGEVGVRGVGQHHQLPSYYHPWHSNPVKVKLILWGTTLLVCSVRTCGALRILQSRIVSSTTLPYGHKAYSFRINLYIRMQNVEILKPRPLPLVLHTTSCALVLWFTMGRSIHHSTPSPNATAFYLHLLQLKMFLSWPFVSVCWCTILTCCIVRPGVRQCKQLTLALQRTR